jgi:hypothetical protein
LTAKKLASLVQLRELIDSSKKAIGGVPHEGSSVALKERESKVESPQRQVQGADIF